MIEFDKRCMYDQESDEINLSSRYEKESYPDQFCQTRKPISSCLKVIKGVPTKKPFFMLGNNLQIMFYPNPKGRNQASILRWGFKIKVTPIFGFMTQNIKENARVLKDLTAAISVANIVVAEYLGFYLEGSDITTDEKLNKKYLSLPLIQNGLRTLPKSDCSQLNAKKPSSYFSQLREEIT